MPAFNYAEPDSSFCCSVLIEASSSLIFSLSSSPKSVPSSNASHAPGKMGSTRIFLLIPPQANSLNHTALIQFFVLLPHYPSRLTFFNSTLQTLYFSTSPRPTSEWTVFAAWTISVWVFYRWNRPKKWLQRGF